MIWNAIWHNRIYAGWYTVYFDWNYFSIIFIWYKCQCGERADPPGKFFYLQVVCGNNVKSEAVKTNIFISRKHPDSLVLIQKSAKISNLEMELVIPYREMFQSLAEQQRRTSGNG